MRRRIKTFDGWPRRLAVFRSDDWEGRDEAERYGAWLRARDEWADAHGWDIVPGDDAASRGMPDGEFRIEDI